MQTFDLILFRGSDFVSNAISKIERAMIQSYDYDFTHVGVCMLGRDLNQSMFEKAGLLMADKTYVFESTMSGSLSDGVPDVSGRSHLGCQLRDLDEVIKAYKGTIAWAPLLSRCRPPPENIPALVASINTKYGGAFYDASAVDLFGAVFPTARKCRDCGPFKTLRKLFCGCCCGSERLFCSELAANIYKEIGAFPCDLSSEDVVPLDFITNPKSPTRTLDADRKVPVIFGPLIIIKKY